jgi:membrane protease YdiL (CAAX protease family)
MDLDLFRGVDSFLLQKYQSNKVLVRCARGHRLIGGVYLFGLLRRGYRWDRVGIRPVEKLWVVYSLILAILVIPLTAIITILVMLAMGLPMENPQIEFLLPEDLTDISAFLMLLLAGVIAPFAEELLFRGVFYTMLKERWGVWPGVLISSFVFGLAHANFAVGLTAFLLGILLALVFEYSQSLWTAVLIHAINNSSKLVLLYLLLKLGFDLQG